MRLYNAPSFVGIKSPEFKESVEKIYNAQFLSKIFSQLNIIDDKKEHFSEFIKKTAVSYLTGKDMNSGRLRPSEQKNLFSNYISALKDVQKRFHEIGADNSAHANFHNSLKDVIQKSDAARLEEMFSPYISVGDGKGSYGGISDKMFIEFVDTLIMAAEKAPKYINENDKADIGNDFILWWLRRIGQNWSSYSDVSFSIGDYYKEFGGYKSPCMDALYDLLNAVDENITRKDIETAMRKHKKIK